MSTRGTSRRQDGCESANDSFRKILMLRPHKMFCTWCINSFQAFSLSEAFTFGVGYICNAFRCRESRDKSFSVERPCSTGADVETEHGGCLICDGHIRLTLGPGVDGQHTLHT